MARYADIEDCRSCALHWLKTSARYGGVIAAGQIVITAGCNQGFCLATGTGEGRRRDHPALPYFNHGCGCYAGHPRRAPAFRPSAAAY
jgi:hypothetical protein